MKKTTISISAAVAALAFSLCLQSCGEGKKEATATDSISVGTTDTLKIDSTAAPSSSRTIDTTDTGGRNTQAPRPKT